MHLRAYGVFEAEPSTPAIWDERNDAPNWLPSFFSTTNARPSKKTLLQCPVDFEVTVNRASLVVLGKCLDVPISGKGYLRVLYADKQLRIFVSCLWGWNQFLLKTTDWLEPQTHTRNFADFSFFDGKPTSVGKDGSNCGASACGSCRSNVPNVRVKSWRDGNVDKR